MSGPSIRGLVLDDTAWPIAGATVTIQALSPGAASPDIAQSTDGTGRYVWSGLDEGRYQVSVLAEGFHPASAQTYSGIVSPGRIDFHLTRSSSRRGSLASDRLPAEAAGNPMEQVTTTMPETTRGDDVVDEID
jgi:hypothetical protein